VHTYNTRYSGGRGRKFASSRSTKANLMRSYFTNRIPKTKRTGGVVQVVEHSPSTHKALSSITCIPKKKKKKKKLRNTIKEELKDASVSLIK
jgi:hypothetical protein